MRVVSRLKKQKLNTSSKVTDYISKMLIYRDSIVKNVFKYKNENQVFMPVSFINIIANIQGQMGLSKNSIVDITPLEAFELIEENFKKMNQLGFSPLTTLFEIIYYFYLSPKELLIKKRFHRKALILLLETIALKHREAIVHPNEKYSMLIE